MHVQVRGCVVANEDSTVSDRNVFISRGKEINFIYMESEIEKRLITCE